MNSPEKYLDREPVNIEYILGSLRNKLPKFASDLIASRRDMSDSAKQTFKGRLDNPLEHSPDWHQHGILTHSEEFLRYLDKTVPDVLDGLGIADKVRTKLAEEIDGVSKADLLRVTALLHDVGKFTSRKFEGSPPRARFVGHEIDSGTIIRGELRGTLDELSLSDAQIEYIATCAEHHFELGKARNDAKDAGGGYTMAFAKSEAFQTTAAGIMEDNPDVALEIGLMFLADSFSKTEVAAVADTDEQIDDQRPELKRAIEEKKLDPCLINQALQQPVNLEVGKRYLRLWCELYGSTDNLALY